MTTQRILIRNKREEINKLRRVQERLLRRGRPDETLRRISFAIDDCEAMLAQMELATAS
jgi:hypothetical protein